MAEENAVIKEREVISTPYEFVLKINDYIVCQRYFSVTNFNTAALSSAELTNAVRNCAEMIKGDLKRKSRLYSWAASPLVFNNDDEAEAWLNSEESSRTPQGKLVLIKNAEGTVDTYVLGKNTLEPYNSYFNYNEFAVNEGKNVNNIEFGFYYRGRKIVTVGWDGNAYPKFVRTNIDLSNSKNKYKSENGGVYTYEAFIIEYLSKDGKDLIPDIIQELTSVLSSEHVGEYTRSEKYGDVEYSFNVKGLNSKLYKDVEDSLRKKTNAYFKTIGYKPTKR